MIRTKSVYDGVEDGDGYRVLVTRFYPRGRRRGEYDAWMRELSPSPGLLGMHKRGEVEWDDFLSRLGLELRGSQASMAAIDVLREKDRTGTVTLLCYEREGEPCHRYMIKEMVGGSAVPG